MKIEKLLIAIAIILLFFGFIIPVVILLSPTDWAIKGQIGDTFGGTSAPFINISAIIVVIVTYIYQVRSDKSGSEKEAIASSFKNLKEEFTNIVHVITNTDNKGAKETVSFPGKEAIFYIIRALNNDQYSLELVREFTCYNSIVNAYQYLSSIMEEVKFNKVLSENEKKMFLSQFSLFYRNNLFIDKEQRGNEICKTHNRRHTIPVEIYSEILKIESMVI